MTRENGLDIKLINPKNGAKYSPNLYKWLNHRHHKHRAWMSRIYKDSSGVYWIGHFYDGYFSGNRLMAVLCFGVRADSYAWRGMKWLSEVNGFWGQYTQDGRCAIDKDHSMSFVGDETRWGLDIDTRHCLWCGKAIQRLKRYMKAIECTEWVNVPTESDGHNVTA